MFTSIGGKQVLDPDTDKLKNNLDAILFDNGCASSICSGLNNFQGKILVTFSSCGESFFLFLSSLTDNYFIYDDA